MINAYIAPRMVAHLETLERRLGGAQLRVMQSNGNAIGTGAGARRSRCGRFFRGRRRGWSGTAGLVRAMGVDRFITFDMGGTSTDVSLFDGGAKIRTLSYPGGYAVRTPVIDIHTVGAGGGSIAAVDAGGSLKVGPESAGRQSGSGMLWRRRSADGDRRRPGCGPAGGGKFPGRPDAPLSRARRSARSRTCARDEDRRRRRRRAA